jgi:hypothetical protein
MSFIKAGDPISTSTTSTNAPVPEKPNLKRTLHQRDQSTIKDGDEDDEDEDEDDVKYHHLERKRTMGLIYFLYVDTLGLGADEASKSCQKTTYGLVPGGNQKVGPKHIAI